jgi:hypothetical protein
MVLLLFGARPPPRQRARIVASSTCSTWSRPSSKERRPFASALSRIGGWLLVLLGRRRRNLTAQVTAAADRAQALATHRSSRLTVGSGNCW